MSGTAANATATAGNNDGLPLEQAGGEDGLIGQVILPGSHGIGRASGRAACGKSCCTRRGSERFIMRWRVRAERIGRTKEWSCAAVHRAARIPRLKDLRKTGVMDQPRRGQHSWLFGVPPL